MSFTDKVTKEYIEDLYINQNKSRTEICEMFGISVSSFVRMVHKFDIHKDRRLSSKLSVAHSTRTHESYVLGGAKSAETQKKSWELKSDDEKASWAEICRSAQLNMDQEAAKRKVDRARSTYFSKPDVEIAQINKRRSESMVKYWEDFRKSPNYREEMDSIWSKRIPTCMEKYGVPYACMTPSARKYSSDSKPNLAFAKLLEENGIEYEREFPIDRKSYDFKVGNILIEINPTATHNSTMNIFDRDPLPFDYHYNKSKLAFDNGYRCIHIFDWDNLDLIIQQLKRRETVYARNCEVGLVDSNVAREYLNNYHLQGYCKSDVNIGLFNNGNLVSIMTFGKPRYNSKYQYELLRLCSDKYVIGGAEKMFSYFKDNYSPESIISYCDFGKFNGNVYEKLGFKLNCLSIGRHWFNPFSCRHITDNLLRKLGADKLIGTNYGKGTDNELILIADGFLEVYDAGQQTYIYNY